MDCSRKAHVLSSFFLILTHFITSVTSISTCFNNRGNYTQGSIYSSNLDRAFSSLLTNVNDTGFHYASFGQNQDTANAFVMCRADYSIEACKNCTDYAISEAQVSCPNNKHAFIWEQDDCMLKYSNESLYGKLETKYRFYIWNVINASSPAGFMKDLGNLLKDLYNKASNGGDVTKVATGNVSGPDFQNIYAMVQCKPDLSPQDCTTCLNGAAQDIPKFCDGKIGCRILLESCFLRFESNQFYNVPTTTTSVPDAPTPQLQAQPQIMSPPPPPPPQAQPQIMSPPPPPGKNLTIVIVVASIAGLVIIVTSGWIIFKKITKQQPARENLENGDEICTVESLQYEFGKIRSATNDFSDENKLGEEVSGKLQNGREIAVKRLSENSGQGDLEFKNEVLLLARLEHRNLVRLLGFSLKGEEKLLVYEYVQNASLDKFIFDPMKRSVLDWDKRSKIIGGIARGLLYFHKDSPLRIIHRDLKPGNVLLDSEMNPKIADFGMARLFAQDDQTQGRTSRIVGTYGYMAPEYARHGQFSTKSDVFSFGVILLEILSGQKNNSFRNEDSGLQDLLSFTWKKWREGTAADLIDPILKSASGSTREILGYIHIGLLCVQGNVANRPTMASVVLMLSSLSLTLAFPSEPAFFVRGFKMVTSNMRESDKGNDTSSSDMSKNDPSISEQYPR